MSHFELFFPLSNKQESIDIRACVIGMKDQTASLGALRSWSVTVF